MNASEIIEALGDTAAVAAELGVSVQAASNWKSRGIARSRLLDVHLLALKKGIQDITVDVVRQAAASPRRQSEAV